MAITSQSPVFVVLTATGLTLARTLASRIDADIHGLQGRCPDAPYQFDDTIAHIGALFVAGRPIIGICASGILIRAVAPYLLHKTADAPLLALSDDGLNIVPLLGGHHGGLAIAKALASKDDCHIAVTTAGNITWAVSLDEPPQGWRLANPDQATSVMATLLAGTGARRDGEAQPALDKWLAEVPHGDDVILTATMRAIHPASNQLVFCPQQLVLGVGCARGCAADELISHVLEHLATHDLNPAAIAAIVSVDIKADEPAIKALAAHLDVPFQVFDVARLEAETPRLANPSDVVFNEIGAHGVAEAAALAATGANGRLIVEKQKSASATMAVAMLDTPCLDIIKLGGRKTGRVMLVGIGPGQSSWRTPEASRMIQTADELVGYGLYIDILGAIAAHIPRRDFKLGEEEARCRYALETAATGKDVAIICSGDAGIYAMGALVFELLDRTDDTGGVSDAARRVEIVSAPGISALQAAAARSGALLGHDFCTISLSDLLTPWTAIEQRIHAAGAGDFVIAFYNPVSMRRRSQLAAARDILISYRGDNVPVLLAQNLGRPDEKLTYITLGTLNIDDVDMLTVVMVGAQSSRMFERGAGPAIYTPRGYAKHLDNSMSQDKETKA
ncbi:precorrin-3B C(17)-methyltransferase [Candidatus Puniceispirillum sp.]|uniref:precorrin-3B C(17)-methyltransferase n=1 Tax=Candidatus Puniceispirillum sp. TaxID=2026719 RepID=UPI001ED160AD|nr:precorrin-3B C(17)-methyltransferase [Candidatus Puniceispirillum sp.]